MKGSINDKAVIVLIKCRASHNFISDRLTSLLKLPKEMSNYGLILGLGTAVKGRGVCKNGELKIGDWRVTDNFLPLELGGVDVILGMHWLHSLGVTEVDWKKLTMILYRGGQKVILRGDPSLTKARVSLKSMMKSWSSSDLGFLVECRASEEA
ncbi:ty3-gypsy retroelement transposase [Cucumis melo var. makuwa]|uniref:Ty3-gypsy retroelement transposase n=1 Tax=Cucumis melo var. makuwa TaxID=1194695 RepID=A0A5D3C1P2_CUCMM|nr:ty3-gypsy retroelement transposase [Cucumis melo var. makuwa]